MPSTATIRAAIDARAQFVGFASASIERCGAESPARSLAHNRVLCESFGRDWVVGCCRQIGGTVLFLLDADEYAEWRQSTVNVHVFVGLSATLGVAWCACVDEDSLLLRCRASSIDRNLGNDRFLAKPSALVGCSVVIDSKGNAVAPLRGAAESDPFGVWVGNCKWLVKVEAHGANKGLIVWGMSDGEPASQGVGVKFTLPLSGVGAGFSHFDPRGDELVVAGNFYSEDEQEVVGSHHLPAAVCFVGLEKSIEAGVTVEVKERILLPYANPFDLVWSSEGAIITLHSAGLVGNLYTAYNTDIGQQRICLGDMHSSSSSICEVYAASDLCNPSFRYEWSSVSKGGVYATCKLIYPVREPTSTESAAIAPDPRPQLTASICDSFTGQILAVVTVFLTRP
ncbi:hypothetical protein Pelo_8483 [Pelomyxa schiedti]|nr:hypothetical protein Pelo_8483 [Pelomyxa schiedti]